MSKYSNQRRNPELYESTQIDLIKRNSLKNQTIDNLLVPPLKKLNTNKNFPINNNNLITSPSRNLKIGDVSEEKEMQKIGFLLPYINDENTLEDHYVTEQYFNIITIDELICTLLVILGIGSGIAYLEIRTCDEETCDKSEDNDNYDEAINFSLVTSSVAAFGFILMLIPKYYHSYKLYKSAKYISIYENFFNTTLPVELAVEFIFAIIHPNLLFKNKYFTTSSSWNFYEITYNVNDFLLLINLFRIIYLVKFAIVVSDFYSGRADRICKLMAKRLSFFFAFKSLLITYTAFTLIFCIVLFCFLFSYLLKIIEGPLHYLLGEDDAEENNLNYFFDNVWVTLSTMATVGYGDVFPRSLIGRVLGCIIAISGPLLVALITNFFQIQTHLDDEEKQAHIFVLRLQHKNLIRKAAGKLFRANFEYVIYKRKFVNDLIENNELNKKQLLLLAKKRFLARKKFKHLVHEFQIKFKMEEDIDKVKRKIDLLDEALIDSNENMKNLIKGIELLINNITREGTGNIGSSESSRKLMRRLSSKSIDLKNI